MAGSPRSGMNPLSSFPGVHIEDSARGNHAIAGVSASITAFIGRARRGPVNLPTPLHSFADFQRIFGDLWLESPMSYAVRDFFINGGTDAVIVRLQRGAKHARGALPSGSDISDPKLRFEAANPGEWGNRLRVTLRPGNARRDGSLFSLEIREIDAGTGAVSCTETHDRLSTQRGHPRNVRNVLEKESALLRVGTFGTWPTSTKPWITARIDLKLTKGSDGTPITSREFLGEAAERTRCGIFALDHCDLFNLLCLPPSGPDADIDGSVIRAAAAYCEMRRAFLILDSPASWTDARTALAGIADLGTRSPNAAVFHPHLIGPDPLQNGVVRTFLACGAVAGVFARTDEQRGVWKAPAGPEAALVGVTAPSVALLDSQLSTLNAQAINCLRSLPDAGCVIWGSRTLDGRDDATSVWKYIPVRRLALFIEESVIRGIRWAVFEPNDEPLWAALRLQVEAFMMQLFRQGALQGTTVREAFFVKCDRETNTTDDVSGGLLNLVIGFAPLKPTEFVIIKIQQKTGITEQ
jgi:phage tail sheath protein FI